jgi:hypothetical protein
VLWFYRNNIGTFQEGHTIKFACVGDNFINCSRKNTCHKLGKDNNMYQKRNKYRKIDFLTSYQFSRLSVTAEDYVHIASHSAPMSRQSTYQYPTTSNEVFFEVVLNSKFIYDL